MNTPRQSLGKWGEQQAGRYLQQAGYEILARNYRSEYGEIDLIARQGEVIVFVEVKTRASGSLADPEAAVTAAKFEHLQAAAETYLQTLPVPEADCRIDVIAIRVRRGAPPEIEHFENVSY